MEYTNYHEGMILRSGSRVRGARSYQQAQDPSRSKTMSALNHSSSDWTSNAHDVRATASMSGVYGQRWQSGNPAYDVGFNTTTTVTRTVAGVLEDDLNKNNNARIRPRSRLVLIGDAVEHSETEHRCDHNMTACVRTPGILVAFGEMRF